MARSLRWRWVAISSTQPSNTTAGLDRILWGIPLRIRSTGNLKAHLWTQTSVLLQVLPKMTPVHAIEGDVFDNYVAYLRQSATYAEQVYILEKAVRVSGRRFA